MRTHQVCIRIGFLRFHAASRPTARVRTSRQRQKKSGAGLAPLASLIQRPPASLPLRVRLAHGAQAAALHAQPLLDLLEPQAEAGLFPALQQALLAVGHPLVAHLGPFLDGDLRNVAYSSATRALQRGRRCSSPASRLSALLERLLRRA